MMRPFSKLLSFEDAETIMLKSVRQVERKEEISIGDVGGRVLAREIVSDMDVPPFDRSAMDGFAVRAEDTFPAGKFDPVELRVVGKSLAGHPSGAVVKNEECIEIATGAKLPDGVDAIVKVENTEVTDDTVKIFAPVHPGQDVSKRGEDIKAGQSVMKPGAYLDPSNVGVAAALGIEKLSVFERPTVAIVPTGAEIAPPGADLQEGQVYDINTYTLSQVALLNGCMPRPWGIVLDELEALRKALHEALSEDLVLFSGGSSVGETDILVDILKERGEILFHGIQVKPGKPTLCGEVDGKLVVGMPGYPASCLTNAYTLLAPVLRKMARVPPENERHMDVPISRRVVSSLGRLQLLTVRIEEEEAVPVYKESGAITSLADADGYIEIPINTELVEKGELVRVKLFRPV
ncbi:MAG: molybdenum cofactor biosynthesis protein [Candidatus Thermoplasmatota archaeon]|nr:molybdenum cofactor biosynthesis protein [Candidatus Thermoplasmatota archaeon]